MLAVVGGREKGAEAEGTPERCFNFFMGEEREVLTRAEVLLPLPPPFPSPFLPRAKYFKNPNIPQ